MMTEDPGYAARLREQLIAAYFSEPERQVQVDPGTVLIAPGQPHDRLYLVLRGRLANGGLATRRAQTYDAGDLVGVRTFFIPGALAERPVVALQSSVLAYIDHDVPLVELGEAASDLTAQFTPLVIEQLLAREADDPTSPYDLAGAHTERHLNRLLSLGQLATGIAHELNNSLTVLSTGTEWLCEIVDRDVASHPGLGALFFQAGLEGGRQLSSREARTQAEVIRKALGLEADVALSLAKTGIGVEALRAMPPVSPEETERLCRLWEMGATLYDMRLAAVQAEHVVISVKTLGARQERRRVPTDVNETIRAAVCLTRNCHKELQIHTELGDLPKLEVNPGDLIQIWTNLIRNACEALRQHPRPAPLVHLTSAFRNNTVEVAVADNGPGIPPEIMPHIFSPHVTSRDDGTGLGLTIVNQFVTDYGGRVDVRNSPEGATFTVCLPVASAAPLPAAGT